MRRFRQTLPPPGSDQVRSHSHGLRSLNYQVIGLGQQISVWGRLPADTKVADPEEVQKSLAISGANVTFFESPDLGTPLRTKTFKIGEVKACVVSVLGKSRRDDVAPAGVANNITFSDPDEEIRKAIEQFKGEKPHLLILLNNGTVDEAKEFAASSCVSVDCHDGRAGRSSIETCDGRPLVDHSARPEGQVCFTGGLFSG